MKTQLLRLLPLIVLCTAAHLRGSEDTILAAVRAADDQRLAATIAGDAARLAEIYSDELHYVHSSGRHDNKASQLKGVAGGTNKYDRFEHQERVFTPAGPGVVLMRGRVHVHMSDRKTGAKTMNDINYLAVWREEKGQWRFLAWQASKGVEEPSAKK